MTWPLDPTPLAAHWQRITEIGAESGSPSIIALGMNSFEAENLRAILAWQQLARRSTGLVDPRLVVGGEGELWLMASQIWQSRIDPLAVAGTHNVFYGGSDLATRAAALTVNAHPTADLRHPFLPPAMAWMLTPVALPGSGHSALEQLPFLLDEPLFTAVIAPSQSSSPLDQLELWAAILLAVALVFVALLL